MNTFESWGRLSVKDQNAVLASPAGSELLGRGKSSILPRGLGRSYGDVCLNPGGTLLSSAALDNFLDFDPETGLLTAQAGVTLSQIQRTFAPRGFMLAVSPGTQFVTVGGAIANDVHGKNHHSMGTFGDHVIALTLTRSDQSSLECSLESNPEMFRATIGGLGLTGFITQATIKLQPVQSPWLETESIPFKNLAEFLKLSDESEADFKYSVSWVNCATPSNGRGIFMRGNHAGPQFRKNSTMILRSEPSARKLSVPVDLPFSLVNKLSVTGFNLAYFYANAAAAGKHISHYQPYFYPLDAVANWNRIYGNKGFYQYQVVVPRAGGEVVLQEMLDKIRAAGQGSFLSVLKTMGNAAPAGLMSFSRPGITLALDFANLGSKTLHLLDALDEIVLAAGGAGNPSKDARMSRAMFDASFSNIQEFNKYRDPAISSAMSRRLLGS
jgi:FAD/FMN-containing dehydrogenase